MGAGSASVRAVGDASVDGLLSGLKWTGAIGFGFPGSASEYGVVYGNGEPQADFAPVSLAQQNTVRAALIGAGGAGLSSYGSVASFTNLKIREAVGREADIRLAESTVPGTAYAYYPSEAADGVGGDIWFGTRYRGTIFDYREPVLGNYAYQTIFHELGHALGLKHANEAGGPADVAVPAERDSIEFTTMSYRSYAGSLIQGYTYERYGAPQTFMMLDIQALQVMYGANYTAHAGDTTYRWDPATGEMSLREGASAAFVGQGTPGANRVFLTVWDGGGDDTYDLSNYRNDVSIDLRPGESTLTARKQLAFLGNDGVDHHARGNVYNALLVAGDARALIENAIGGQGDDTLVGNVADNTLDGGAGSDRLHGGAGRDVFAFSTAPTAGQIDYIDDFSVTDDTIRLDASAFSGLAIGVLDESAFKILGTSLVDADDRILYDALSGTVSFDADGSGRAFGATVFALLDNGLRLSAGNFVVTGSVRVPALHTVTGATPGNDRLTGTRGDDLIDGGAGADRMAGLSGNDTYLVDDVGDVVTELAGDGIDTVKVSLQRYTLAAQVENLTYNGTRSIAAVGNALANLIVGGAGNDRLDGLTGADTLVGGGGDDTYVVRESGAVVVEEAGGGADRVLSQISYTLTDNVEILNLTTSANLDATGNALANTLIGNNGANVLDGRGGADVMTGRGGNDTYVVDDAGDVVVELAGGGIDTVRVSLQRYTLGDHVENLAHIGTKAFAGTGNGLANVITGGAAGDRLDGGAGADRMIGGAGDDTYVVDDIGDVVVERAGGGNDGVLSRVSYTLSDHVEILTLTSGAKLDGTGNGQANTLVGNGNANILDGRGGRDSLTGGGGNDTFVFRIGETDGDRVTDFTGAGAAPGDTLAFYGFGAAARLTHAAGSDLYTITADAAHGGSSETFRLLGVTGLDLLAGVGHDDIGLFG